MFIRKGVINIRTKIVINCDTDELQNYIANADGQIKSSEESDFIDFGLEDTLRAIHGEKEYEVIYVGSERASIRTNTKRAVLDFFVQKLAGAIHLNM